MNPSASTNYLLYLAHGSQEFKNEALGSILSYLRLKKQTGTAQAKILVYTDKADYFRQVLGNVSTIEYVELSASQLKNWRGTIDFIHRVKIELLHHALTNYGGNIVYLDSDTYFVADDIKMFEALKQGQRFMHVQEGLMSQSEVPLHQKLYDFMRTNSAPAWAAVSPATAMYNAGVVGLRREDISLLDEVLQLTDLLYKECPSHVAEQFAFSYCLQQAGPVAEAIPYILHYWHMKDARQVLNGFFNQTKGLPLNELLQHFEKVSVVTAAQTKFAWEARPRWQRGLMRLVGQGWKWPS